MTKVVFNNAYGGFTLSNEACDRLVELGYDGLKLNPNYDAEENAFYDYKYFNDHLIPRHHPLLVKVVEELAEKASGPHSKLEIKEVNGPYRIVEYDGWETVETPETIDWIFP